MFALVSDNQVTQIGEPAVLFPNTSGVTSAFAIEQGALELESGTVDMEDIDDAYESGADNEAVNQEDNINAEQQ